MEPLEQVVAVLKAREMTCQLHRLGENHIAELACGIVVHFAKPLADAQATIAALQARVRELEEWKHIVTGAGTDQESVIRLAAYEYTKIAVQCWKEANAKLESQLTQRTAELEAVQQWKLQLCNLTPGGSEFADDPAYCAEWVRKSREDQHNVILDKYREAKYLKAELKRVKGLVKTYADAKIDFDDKRLQEDHHAWRERYNKLVEAENALLQHRQGME